MAASDARRDAARTLAADAALRVVVGGLQAAGIPVVVLRGPAIASLLYDPGETRLHGDVDLLVPEAAFAAARGVLRELGLAQEHEGADERDALSDQSETWSSPRLGTSVDLHRRIWGVERAAWETLGARTRVLRAGGVAVPAPDSPATALVVALHAAQHGREDGRLMEDLARAVRRLPEDVWREAARRAGDAGAVRRLAVGLSLDPEGRALAARLGLQGRPEGIVEELAVATPPPGSLGLAYVADLPWRRRPAALARKAFPRPQLMRSQWPQARRGRTGLALAYGRRLLWAAAGAPAAWRAWRAARARARR